MKDKVKVYERGFAYLGKRAEDAGFKGEVERMFNFYTMTLIRPGATERDAIRSLEVMIEDLRMRADEKEKQAKV